MKIVVLCQKGNMRSVALAWCLKKHLKHEAIATGFTVTSRRTRKMLYEWSDVIICVAGRYSHWVPEEYKHKLKIWDVGTDKWFKGFPNDLMSLYAGYIERDGI